MSLLKFLKSIVHEAQQKIADTADRHINRYSVRQRKIGLIVFGLVSGIFCFLLIMGIVGSDDSGQAVNIDSISKPTDIHSYSIDSLRSLPSKVMDSLKSILKDFYKDRQY